MKIRTGFVSNSSTSSFCILGIINDDLSQKIQDAIEEWKEKEIQKRTTEVRACAHPLVEANFCPECGKPMWMNNSDRIRDDLHDEWADSPPFGIEVHEGDDGTEIGVYAKSRLQDKSIREAARELAAELKDNLSIEISPDDIDLICGTYYC